MTLNRKPTSIAPPAGRPPRPGRRALLGLMLVGAAAGALQAKEVTYQYYRFEPTEIYGGNVEIQLAEVSFSLGGSDVDRTGVQASCAAQDPNGFEGPNKTVDADINTKWFKGSPLAPLDFDFGSPVTIDSYNWTSANDSVAYSRNPVSWYFYGSTDGTSWELLDARSNYPINNSDFTVQAGFPIPESVLPIVDSFGLDDGGAGGVPAIVLNGSGIPLAWSTSYADLVDLDPSPGSVTEDGTTTVTLPDNSTVAYTLTAGQTGVSDISTSSINLRTVVGGSATYRYIRFTPVQLRSTGVPIQLSEFEFYDGATLVPVASVSNYGGSSPAGEAPANAIDGDYGSKWLNFTASAGLQFDFGEPTVESPTPTIDGYSFVTGNDAPGRDPVRWKLEGSDDATTWTLIENVDFTYPTPSPRNVPTGTLPLPGASLPPAIASFGGPSTVVEGTSVTLSWATSGADTAEIDQMVGPVATSGSTLVTPPVGETTYTLTAYSAGGIASATAEYTVTVLPLPTTTTIDYDDFSSVGTEIQMLGTATTTGGVLRLTEDTISQNGAAWFILPQDVSGGFEATFAFQMNQEEGAGVPPADGFAFVIQNSVDGFGATNPGEAEKGLPADALNISFRSFVTTPTAPSFEVLAGSNLLASVSAWGTPGVELDPLPGYPYSIASPVGSAPYQVRVVYVPGDLDVYFDGIAVIQNLDVDLAAIGAVDAEGKGYAGFTARTGLYYHTTDITEWHIQSGDFTETLPFGMVKSVPVYDPGTGLLVAYDLVWNATEGSDYEVMGSGDLSAWDFLSPTTILGVDGQLGYRVDVDPVTMPKEFYRVDETVVPE